MELDHEQLLGGLLALLLLLYGLTSGAHLLSIVLCALRTSPASPPPSPTPRVTLIRPVRGLDEVERITLASTFSLNARDTQIIFCAEDASDEAIPFLEGLIARHPAVDARVLIGSDLGSPNPKLNNIVKGWHAATSEWVLITDSNVMLPPDYIERILRYADENTGCVSAPPIGSAPLTFWAEVECAFLNTFQARWQYAADVAGQGFVQGKTMLWRKADLDGSGGIRALARELAEDAASTKLVRSWGKKVRLADPQFQQPLGTRSSNQVISRQSRWAQLRRGAFPSHYASEGLTGALPALLLLIAAAILADLDPVMLALAHLTIWYGAEAALAHRMGWHWSAYSLPASIVRDALLPLIWITGWKRTGYVWRGNTITTGEAPRLTNAAPSPELAVLADDARKG